MKSRRYGDEDANIPPSFRNPHTFGLSRVHDSEGTLQEARKGYKGRNKAALAMSQYDARARTDQFSSDRDDSCHQVAPDGTHRFRSDILEDLRWRYVEEPTTPIQERGDVQLQVKAHRRRRVPQLFSSFG